MKILLIDPPYERFIGFRSEWFPLGLSYIASYLSAQGHDVKIYHAEHGPETGHKSLIKYADNFNRYGSAIACDDHPVWKEIREQIRSFMPAVVGISAITSKIPSALKLAEICKDINPETIVVFGNHHPTIRPVEILSNQNIDFVIRGEGEETFHLFIDCVNCSNPDYRSVAGLSFRDNGKIIHNGSRPPIADLDKLPFPARDKLINLDTYTTTQLGMVMTSRGCPYRCGFCASHNMWGKSVRFRSVTNVIAEIKELKERYSIKNIVFMDDAFTVDKNRVLELCEALIGSRMNITWSCLTRINMITDEIITLMKKAGCTKVDVGIESGNQRVLDMINKKITLNGVRKAVEVLRKNRIFWSGFFMFGFPTETEEEILDTLRFLKELKPNWANISIFTPYPGTPLFELAVEQGMVTDPPDYTLYSHQNTASRFTDKIPKGRFQSLATHILSEVHAYNSSYKSLIRRALTRNYHQDPGLLFQDVKKLAAWLKK